MMAYLVSASRYHLSNQTMAYNHDRSAYAWAQVYDLQDVEREYLHKDDLNVFVKNVRVVIVRGNINKFVTVICLPLFIILCHCRALYITIY